MSTTSSRGRSTTTLAAADEAVLALAVSLASSLDPAEARARVLTGAATVLGADRTMLVALDDAGDVVLIAEHEPMPPPPGADGGRLDPALLRVVVRDVLRDGASVVRDGRRLRVVSPDEGSTDAAPPRSILAITLALEVGRTGALVAVRCGGEPYGAADARAARSLAALADSSLRNADLHSRSRESEAAVRNLERVKSDFLRLASHELRAPLSVLRGYLEMLGDRTLGDLPPGAALAVPIVARKVAQMNRLVDDMLETARLEDSRMSLALERWDLRDIARSAVSLRRDVGRRLVMRLPDDCVVVHVDRARIETIVANLVDNAAKYSPDGSPIDCVVSAAGATALVAVVDRGAGIAKADMGRLFTRFGRIVNADTAHVPGTGLGLYLAREIAQRHGGNVTVESAVGKGSTFTLTLPRIEDSAA